MSFFLTDKRLKELLEISKKEKIAVQKLGMVDNEEIILVIQKIEEK